MIKIKQPHGYPTDPMGQLIDTLAALRETESWLRTLAESWMENESSTGPTLDDRIADRLAVREDLRIFHDDDQPISPAEQMLLAVRLAAATIPPEILTAVLYESVRRDEDVTRARFNSVVSDVGGQAADAGVWYDSQFYEPGPGEEVGDEEDFIREYSAAPARQRAYEPQLRLSASASFSLHEKGAEDTNAKWFGPDLIGVEAEGEDEMGD